MVCSPSTRENSAVQSSRVAVNVSKTNIVPLGYAIESAGIGTVNWNYFMSAAMIDFVPKPIRV
uniref:Uncharacterized protein n=1 Tax=Romanomermis culicivorax TaxID=13658 RepID=A0A915IZ58_ROMCU